MPCLPRSNLAPLSLADVGTRDPVVMERGQGGRANTAGIFMSAHLRGCAFPTAPKGSEQHDEVIVGAGGLRGSTGEARRTSRLPSCRSSSAGIHLVGKGEQMPFGPHPLLSGPPQRGMHPQCTRSHRSRLRCSVLGGVDRVC